MLQTEPTNAPTFRAECWPRSLSALHGSNDSGEGRGGRTHCSSLNANWPCSIYYMRLPTTRVATGERHRGAPRCSNPSSDTAPFSYQYADISSAGLNSSLRAGPAAARRLHGVAHEQGVGTVAHGIMPDI